MNLWPRHLFGCQLWVRFWIGVKWKTNRKLFFGVSLPDSLEGMKQKRTERCLSGLMMNFRHETSSRKYSAVRESWWISSYSASPKTLSNELQLLNAWLVLLILIIRCIICNFTARSLRLFVFSGNDSFLSSRRWRQFPAEGELWNIKEKNAKWICCNY